MSEVTDKIRDIVLDKCEQHKQNAKYGYYDYWNDHIKRVVWHAVDLANQYGADAEIVELGALLHDISMPAEYGERSEHHIYSTEMAETLLAALNYPGDKAERVKKCVFNHPGRNQHLRETIEETCVSDADALAHFDRIPSLFSLVYGVLGMGLKEGRENVKNRLQGDYRGLSDRTKKKVREKFEMILEALFVD
ncbi:MAG: HD domain-containing protein [Clostridiales bacterium]|nr:HD domain-containing protein [Clostridiales bacterium]